MKRNGEQYRGTKRQIEKEIREIKGTDGEKNNGIRGEKTEPEELRRKRQARSNRKDRGPSKDERLR